MNHRTEKRELLYQKPWRFVGNFLTVLLAIIYVPFATVLVLGSNIRGTLVWTGVFLIIAAGLYLFLGPFYRPTVVSVIVKDNGLLVRKRDGTESRAQFADVRRIASSSASCAWILKSGEKLLLGPGFGGTQGDVILQSYKEWADGKGLELLEYNTRDGFTSRRVKNLETFR